MSIGSKPTNQTVARNLDSLIKRALDLSGMTYPTFVRSVTQNAFGSLTVWSESDLERLLLACESLGLSPVGRDVFAIGHGGQGSEVVLAVGLEGWAHIVNRHPAFDGLEFTESQELLDGVPAWISCTIHRRDRRVSLTVKEYLCECRRESSAWQTHPRRMLRHKALVQCARLAFDLPTSLGVYDTDEAERVSLARTNEYVSDSKSKRSVSGSATQEEKEQGSPGSSRTEELIETLLSRKVKPFPCSAEVSNLNAGS